MNSLPSNVVNTRRSSCRWTVSVNDSRGFKFVSLVDFLRVTDEGESVRCLPIEISRFDQTDAIRFAAWQHYYVSLNAPMRPRFIRSSLTGTKPSLFTLTIVPTWTSRQYFVTKRPSIRTWVRRLFTCRSLRYLAYSCRTHDQRSFEQRITYKVIDSIFECCNTQHKY